MKCFKLLKSEYDLPPSLFRRIGAVNAERPYYEHVYASDTTQRLIRKHLIESLTAVYGQENAVKRTNKLLKERRLNNCFGLPAGFVIVDVASILKARMDEEMVSELAKESGIK